jgi:hypothetical protein
MPAVSHRPVARLGFSPPRSLCYWPASPARGFNEPALHRRIAAHLHIDVRRYTRGALRSRFPRCRHAGTRASLSRPPRLSLASRHPTASLPHYCQDSHGSSSYHGHDASGCLGGPTRRRSDDRVPWWSGCAVSGRQHRAPHPRGAQPSGSVLRPVPTPSRLLSQSHRVCSVHRERGSSFWPRSRGLHNVACTCDSRATASHRCRRSPLDATLIFLVIRPYGQSSPRAVV